MVAAVTALETWASQLRDKAVVFHIDNETVCYILNKLYTPVDSLMHLVRRWCMLMEFYDVLICPVYINTLKNVDADDLSRLRASSFLDRDPKALPTMTWPTVTDFISGTDN